MRVQLLTGGSALVMAGVPIQGIVAMSTAEKALGIIAVFVVCGLFMMACGVLITLAERWRETMTGVADLSPLTPTQRFLLAASSVTISNNYKCVIDIWETRESETGRKRARDLFEWSWGEFTPENARKSAEHCMNTGFNSKFKEYCSPGGLSGKTASQYSDFQLQLLSEMREQYPKQGMLAWDLVRVLSIVGGAYMGGVMEYREASEIALTACRLLQENFSSWDDMAGSYTFGYQFWRGKKKKDRFRYYKKLVRRTRIYDIPWNTPLREEEL